MELLSCLAYNWQTAWDPDDWGVDMGFLPSTSQDDNNNSSSRSSNKNNTGGRRGKKRTAARNEEGLDSSGVSRPDKADSGSGLEAPAEAAGGSGGADHDEEVWVHRIFYIVAKIANFRAASIPRLQELSPRDEQICLQTRYAEWQRLKSMCDAWNAAVPRPMHPFGYVHRSQAGGDGTGRGSGGKSLFPNIWLVFPSPTHPREEVPMTRAFF